jgi:hypothetical protein
MESQITEYPNATKVKTKNRRVMVISLPENEFVIEMKIVSDKETANIPRAVHECYKNKVTLTGIKISREAAESLLYCLIKELEKPSK